MDTTNSAIAKEVSDNECDSVNKPGSFKRKTRQRGNNSDPKPVKRRKSLSDQDSTRHSTESNQASSGTEVEQTSVTDNEIHDADSYQVEVRSRISLKKKTKCPSARWGHSLCLLTENEAVLIGGQGDKQQLCKDSVWHLDIEQGCWEAPATSCFEGQKPEMRMGHVCVYDALIRAVYIYGGSKHKKWFNDVHLLDTDEWKWTVVKSQGAAPHRAYHSANLFRHEMWIFGGVFPNPDPQPDGCSNQIHVFSPVQESWYQPIVMGPKPAPRSGHSATLLGDQLVVFGGWDAPVPYNDIHILDLCLVEWSSPTIAGQGPSPRSWHASCALAGHRVLIHGGYNGNDPLDDSFILNTDTRSWTEVKLQPTLLARAGHAAICLPYKHSKNERDEVLIFGGGDNDGDFFNDLTCVLVPFETPNILN